MRLDKGLALAGGKFLALGSLIRGYARQVPSLGLLAATVVFVSEASTRRPIAQVVKPFAPERVTLHPAGYAHPIQLRRAGTDTAVLRQMLVTQEYRPVASLRNVRLIVDCGANIGLSAYYLLHRYPGARVIAVEPDADNHALCRQNLAAFADRAIVIQAAVWRENRRLRIVPASRSRGSWAIAVEPWDGGNVEGLTIPEILRRAGESGPIDLLKIDIEGAEESVFADAPAWLDMTRNIAIELHGAKAQAMFARALENYRYEQKKADELTIIYGLRPISMRAEEPQTSDRAYPGDRRQG
jgi:FkbM family methyltransferase